MPVKHLAVDPVTEPPDADAHDVAETLAEEDVGSVVIEEGNRPVGIITDRDITLAVAEDGDLSDTRAADIMSEDPVTISGDAPDVELPDRMAEATVRRLPVVDDDGTLEGIVTLDDVVATAGEELEAIATVIEAQSPEYSP
ncbi:CBS domain-containing protein [Halosegnis sp.]|uniref:CBS domain-containing protein n=1 Tax=Halosegnis sp. TaxID=2864959 RepID=UPI0035D40D5D